jgi:hypothetical protein
VQVLADTRGRLLWASPALPGSTHDLTAARRHGVIPGADQVRSGLLRRQRLPRHRTGRRGPVPSPTRKLSVNQKKVNTNHARNRAPGERAVATLKTWKVLARLRCCPTALPRSSTPSVSYRPSRTSANEVGKGWLTLIGSSGRLGMHDLRLERRASAHNWARSRAPRPRCQPRPLFFTHAAGRP